MTDKKRASKGGNLQARLVRLRGKTIVRIFVLFLLSYSILLSFFFRTILRENSLIEIFPSELIIPIVIHAAVALFIALVVYWIRIVKTYFAKAVAALVLALQSTDFGGNVQSIDALIRSLTPGLSASDAPALVGLLYLTVLVVIAAGIGWAADRLLTRLTQLSRRDAQVGLIIIVAFLFIPPAFSLLGALPKLINQSKVSVGSLPATSRTATSEKPDIYYIVLDRYTNNQTLQDQFDFNNEKFTDFLRGNQFALNENARSNYPYTTMSISSTLNADYTQKQVEKYVGSNLQSKTLYHNMIQKSSVIKTLKQSGYRYYSIGSVYGATNRAPLADEQFIAEYVITVFGRTKSLRGPENTELLNSPLYLLTQLGQIIPGWPVKVAQQNAIVQLQQQVKALQSVTTDERSGGRFVFAHLLIPHEPYYFNADGSYSTSPNPDNSGKPVKQKYIDQVQFINDQMTTIVNNIQKQSGGKAVILFNADEGAYPNVQNATFTRPIPNSSGAENGVSSDENMTTWSDDWLQMKFGIMQAVRIPRATENDLANLSSVNLFRIVLNRYAGANLDYLPQCQFGLTDGASKQYRYADITARFSGATSDYCKQRETVSK